MSASPVLGEMKLSYIAAGPTELRLMLIALTVAMMAVGAKPNSSTRVSGFDLVVGGAGAILLVLSRCKPWSRRAACW